MDERIIMIAILALIITVFSFILKKRSANQYHRRLTYVKDLFDNNLGSYLETLFPGANLGYREYPVEMNKDEYDLPYVISSNLLWPGDKTQSQFGFHMEGRKGNTEYQCRWINKTVEYGYMGADNTYTTSYALKCGGTFIVLDDLIDKAHEFLLMSTDSRNNYYHKSKLTYKVDKEAKEYVDLTYPVQKELYNSKNEAYRLLCKDQKIVFGEEKILNRLLEISALMRDEYGTDLYMDAIASGGQVAVAFKGRYMMMPQLGKKWKKVSSMKKEQLEDVRQKMVRDAEFVAKVVEILGAD